MKIAIVGPSGAGKSTLARHMGGVLRVKHFDLDDILFVHRPNLPRREAHPEGIAPKIQSILKRKAWIVEGVQPLDDIFDNADVIIRIQQSFLTCIRQQWQRFMTDKVRRKKYGLWSTLHLARYTYRQFFEEPTLLTDPKRTWIRSIDRVLEKYAHKTLTVRGRSGHMSVIAQAQDILQSRFKSERTRS